MGMSATNVKRVYEKIFFKKYKEMLIYKIDTVLSAFLEEHVTFFF